MSLESIVEHIVNEARAQAARIVQQAQKEAREIIHQAQAEADTIYQEIVAQKKVIYEQQKQAAIVNARLEQKKNLLRSQQELIDLVFTKVRLSLKKDKFKKQIIFEDRIKEIPEDLEFYLNKIRPDSESEIAKILFA